MAKQQQQKPPKPPKIIDLSFPIGGLVRHAGFQNQEPYTTFFAQNVWPYDPFMYSGATPGTGGRNRGGSRPGLIKGLQVSGTGYLGDGAHAITLLDVCAVVSAGGVTSNVLVAVCNGTLYYSSGSNMVAATGYASFNPNIFCGGQVGLYYYVAEYRVTPLSGTDGQVYSGGGAVSFPSTGNQIHSATNFGAIDYTNDVIYIAHSAAFIANNPSKTFMTGTVAISGGIATFSSASCVPNMVGGTLTITNVEGLIVTGYIDTTHLAVGDPTLVQAATSTWNLEYSYASEASIFSISAGSGTNTLTLNANVLTPAQAAVITADSGMTWQIGRMPQLFNPTTSTYSGIASNAAGNIPVTYGIPPLGCPLACNYRGRLVLAGPGEFWAMSRVLDPTDWDFGASPGDVQRAVSSNTSTTGGLGGPITALIPQSDQFLILSSVDAMWILNGDPAYGGQFQSLSRNIGCIQFGAWTNMPDGSVVFMSKDGLYSLATGQAYPQPLSREKLPSDLLDLDTTANTITLEYDVRHRGVHVYVTPNAGTAGVHYFVDVTTGSYWPMVFGNNHHQPFSLIRYDSWQAGAQNLMVSGCNDGYIRQFSETATNDDGTAIASKVAYGPIRLGGPGFEGIITSIAADLDLNSHSVTCGLFVDHTAQSLVNDVGATGTGTPWYSINWVAGVNHRFYPRCRGSATAILLTGTPPWSIEDIRLTVKRGGVMR